jgi:magnesium-transporting ATPase (P-type)
LLTGESKPNLKKNHIELSPETLLADRSNMAFAGTMVTRGRGRGFATATGASTELGKIAQAALGETSAKPPLLLRMEKFTGWIGLTVVVLVLIIAAVASTQGSSLGEIFFLAVALAVSAIPEGLPVALTVALAIGASRMAKRNVIVRRLVAVEALGSCTFIAADKTGTLTINELTAKKLVFPYQEPFEVTGEGMDPEGSILLPIGCPPQVETMVTHLCLAVALCNEGFLGRQDSGWVHHGDPVDIALLVLAHKAKITQVDVTEKFPQRASIPFESERLFAASLNQTGGKTQASVKGAFERVLPMCTQMITPEGPKTIDTHQIEDQAMALAREGYRVIAVATGDLSLKSDEVFSEEHLNHLMLIGLVGMIDPPRAEAKGALATCRRAGIEVSMITGDHPITAMAVARQVGLSDQDNQVRSGPEIKQANEKGKEALDRLIDKGRVFARVEPQQKLEIVQGLTRLGHFVAMTGDGANDAPALRAAHVGVSMGKKGTDVAREVSDMIITDDNFTSIVAGVEEGRVAYSNVRKVIFLLISTGAAEIVLFFLALATGLPLPLLAVQLLWLNLVTNGIQDVALAFEPAEGGEMNRPPRSPKEPVFNRLMIERTLLSALVMGGLAFGVFQSFLKAGWDIVEARNVTLLLMVLFENVHVFNSRSETRSAFRHNPFRNPLLLFGTVVAQLVHIGAMYTPGLKYVLDLQPIPFGLWLGLLGIALLLLLVMEGHKIFWGWRLSKKLDGTKPMRP